jgi:hypothetical protein
MGQLGNDSDMELEAEMVAPPVESGAMEKKQPL